mgnify:CR=1 FL=1
MKKIITQTYLWVSGSILRIFGVIILLVSINISAQSKINETYLEGTFWSLAEKKVKLQGLLLDNGTVSGYGDKEISMEFMPYSSYVRGVDTYVTVKIKVPSGKTEVIESVKFKYGNLYFTDWVQKKYTELKKVLKENGVYKFSIKKGYNWEFELKLNKF